MKFLLKKTFKRALVTFIIGKGLFAEKNYLGRFIFFFKRVLNGIFARFLSNYFPNPSVTLKLAGQFYLFGI